MVALVLGLTGTTAWQYYVIKSKLAYKMKEAQRTDAHEHRDDLRERVRTLERALSKSSEVEDNLREDVLILTAKVNQLETKVQWLTAENRRLRGEE